MKLFLASAAPDDVRWAAGNGLLDGVFTSPALLGAVDVRDEAAHLLDLAHTGACHVFASVRAIHGPDVHRDARELGRLSDRIVVTMPLVEDTVGVIRRLTDEGIAVGATLVFTPAQALVAAHAGASRLFVAVSQLDLVGHDGVGLIAEVRRVLDASRAECDLVALYPATAAQVAACVGAGADACAVTVDVMRSLLLHPLTDRGVDQFLRDLSARPRTIGRA